MQRHLLVAFAMWGLFSPIFVAAMTASPDTCGAGRHMSTSDDIAKGLPANTCVDDSVSSYLNGGCGSSPYEMLKSGGFIGGGQVQPVSSGTGGSTDASLRQGIDPALACRLFKFFEATKAKGCTVKIISAYRSAQQQEDMCGTGRSGCAAAGKSCHQYGLAVDVQTSCIGWMRAAAPQFQLVFPYYGQHIQCAEHPVAACSTATKPCNGGIKITPDLSRIPSPSQVPDSYYVAPTAAAGNPFQNPNTPFMSNTPVPAPAYSPTSLATPAQINASPEVIPSPDPATTNPLPTATSSIFSVPPPYTYGLSSTTNGSTTTKELTAYEQIQLLNQSYEWNPVISHPPSSASSSTQLNSDISRTTNESDAEGISNTSNSIYDNERPIASSSVAVHQIHVTETFTQNGVTQIGATSAPSQVTAATSMVVALLTKLRDILLVFVQIIQSHPSYGYEAPWKPVGAPTTYR